MRLSTLFGRTLREAPSDADNLAYQLVLRAGLVRQMQAGSFVLLPLGMRVLRRIEVIMHDEMARIAAQEFRTPVIQSPDSWEATGRAALYGPLILHLQDRGERPLIFAPTHEEAVAEVARREITSYRQLPEIIYQIHTKYRDEIRAKGGLMRLREFTMLDAYSLDRDADGLDRSYDRIAEAFERVLQRCGVATVAVEASAGEMGGREPREYMALASFGEDTLALCAACGYAANAEVAVAGTVSVAADDAPSMQLVETPDCKTIADVAAFLKVPETATAKAVFFDTPEHGLVFVVVSGDHEVDEERLRRAIGASQLSPATTEQITAVGAVAGYASPVGLQVASAAGSNGVFVVADQGLLTAGPLVAGANQSGFHLRNVVYGRDWQATQVAAIATIKAGDPCPRCGAPLALEHGVEIGHIFKLGTAYTEAIGASFLDQDGGSKPIVMGSYGIGLERMIQLIVDQHHDANGILWPAAVAPAEVHLVGLGRSEAARLAAEELYEELWSAGVSVLFDDREETPGVKFNDADLIGLPLRVLISERLLASGEVELKPRDGQAYKLPRAELLARLRG